MTLSDRKGALVARIVDLGFAPGGGGRIAIEARPGERFFGFGETSGGLDKRGRRLRMRNRDPHLDTRGSLYVSIPFFLGLAPGGRGHPARGVFLDALAPCRFDVAASVADRVVATTDFDGIDLTVMPGPTPREVTRRFAARVGTGPLPPLWALGHHQSRWSYRNEKEVRAVAAQLRARGIPTDAIHLDIDYMDGYRVFTWHPKRFPNPRRLVSDIARQGFRVVAIIDPGVKVDRSYRVFRDGVERGVFCANEDGSPYSLRVWPGAAALPDFHREEVRAWWGEQHRELTAAGVAGIWNDMNEPAGWRSDVRIGRMVVPFRAQDTRQLVVSDPRDESRTVPFERVRNLYGQQECRATREGLEVEEPARRPFVLTRSGHAGIQRYAAVWTGDNRSRWQHLRSSIPMLTNLSLSGVSFCGADIGGFFLSCSPELYARWIQLGSLYPFARTHTMWATRRQEPWSFGERVANIARASLQLRMRLLPYLYDLFREAERSGTPVWRPLFFEFPEDEIAPGVEDQVMIGPSLLAAPVVVRGEREREVYLPPGAWFSWHDDACYIGPRSVRVAAPLERMPLFVRSGSVIPTRSSVTHVGEVPVEPWVLEVFPGADADGEFVEDDGESLAYRDGVVARSGYHLWHRVSWETKPPRTPGKLRPMSRPKLRQRRP